MLALEDQVARPRPKGHRKDQRQRGGAQSAPCGLALSACGILQVAAAGPRAAETGRGQENARKATAEGGAAALGRQWHRLLGLIGHQE